MHITVEVCETYSECVVFLYCHFASIHRIYSVRNSGIEAKVFTKSVFFFEKMVVFVSFIPMVQFRIRILFKAKVREVRTHQFSLHEALCRFDSVVMMERITHFAWSGDCCCKISEKKNRKTHKQYSNAP